MSKHIYLHVRRHVNPLAKKAAAAAHDGGEWGIRWSEAKGMGAATPKEKFFPTQAQRDQYAAEVEKKDGFVEFLAWSNPPGARDAGGEVGSEKRAKVEAYRRQIAALEKRSDPESRAEVAELKKELAALNAAPTIDADTWLFKTNSWELESWTNKTASWALQRAKELTTVGNRVVDIFHNGQFYKQVLPSNPLLPHQEKERRKDRGVGG